MACPRCVGSGVAPGRWTARSGVTPPAYGHTMMNETRHDESRHDESVLPGQQTLPFAETGADGSIGHAARGAQGTYDDTGGSVAPDEPIDFALTAAAHRVVTSDGPPPLTVAPDPSVDDPGFDAPGFDDPGDTRPSRARALRRAGLSVTAIADQLGVDELIARAWVDDVAAAPPPASRRRQLRPGAAAPPSVDVAADGDDVGLQLVRAQASRDALPRLADDPGFALGLGLLTALRSPDGASLTLTTADERLAGRIVAWLRAYAGLTDTDLRVVLRLGRDVAGDLARSRWADALDLPADRIAAARTRGVLAVDEIEALLRIVEPSLAATVVGWCDAVTAAEDASADVAF